MNVWVDLVNELELLTTGVLGDVGSREGRFQSLSVGLVEGLEREIRGENVSQYVQRGPLVASYVSTAGSLAPLTVALVMVTSTSPL